MTTSPREEGPGVLPPGEEDPPPGPAEASGAAARDDDDDARARGTRPRGFRKWSEAPRRVRRAPDRGGGRGSRAARARALRARREDDGRTARARDDDDDHGRGRPPGGAAGARGPANAPDAARPDAREDADASAAAIAIRRARVPAAGATRDGRPFRARERRYPYPRAVEATIESIGPEPSAEAPGAGEAASAERPGGATRRSAGSATRRGGGRGMQDARARAASSGGAKRRRRRETRFYCTERDPPVGASHRAAREIPFAPTRRAAVKLLTRQLTRPFLGSRRCASRQPSFFFRPRSPRRESSAARPPRSIPPGSIARGTGTPGARGTGSRRGPDARRAGFPGEGAETRAPRNRHARDVTSRDLCL